MICWDERRIKDQEEFLKSFMNIQSDIDPNMRTLVNRMKMEDWNLFNDSSEQEQ